MEELSDEAVCQLNMEYKKILIFVFFKERKNSKYFFVSEVAFQRKKDKKSG